MIHDFYIPICWLDIRLWSVHNVLHGKLWSICMYYKHNVSHDFNLLFLFFMNQNYSLSYQLILELKVMIWKIYSWSQNILPIKKQRASIAPPSYFLTLFFSIFLFFKEKFKIFSIFLLSFFWYFNFRGFLFLLLRFICHGFFSFNLALLFLYSI